MIIIPSTKAEKIQASPSTTIWEFPTGDRDISGAVAQIKGRYPEKGFAINQKSKELAFVIAGNGYIVSPKTKYAITIGDIIFIDKGECFAWQGNMRIFMATSPTFNPKQHDIIEP